MLSFYEKIYTKLRKVPKGKVTTYRDLAHAVNSKAYRAVGTAMNKNPYAYAAWGGAGGSSSVKQKKLVSCHRVINSDGKIGGFASGARNKIKMLKSEGIEINDGKIDLKKYLYKF